MSIINPQSSELLRQVDTALKALCDNGSNEEADVGRSNSNEYYYTHPIYLSPEHNEEIPRSKSFMSQHETDGKESSADHSMAARTFTDYDLTMLGSSMAGFSDFNEAMGPSQYNSSFIGDMSDSRSMTPSTLSDLSYAPSRESTAVEENEFMDSSSQTSKKPSRAPRKRKKGAMKADKPAIPTLTGPLSDLTKDYHHLPFRNMEEWVNRPAEVRWKEVEQRQGYVARPMNSFMLYRSAFAERTKFWCLQNNHQVVSSVSGASWPLEPPHIREFYNELAKTERKNHHAAHPGYKFSPSKAAQGKKRKTRASTDISEDSCGFDGSVVQTSHPNSPTTESQNQTPPRPGKSAKSGANSWAYLGYPYNKAVGGPTVSSWNHSNPGKPIPPTMDMPKDEMDGEYFQSIESEHDVSIYPFPRTKDTKVVNVMIRPVQGPSSGIIHRPYPMARVPIDPRLERLAADPNEMQNLKFENNGYFNPTALYAPMYTGFTNCISNSNNILPGENGNSTDNMGIDDHLEVYCNIDGTTQPPAPGDYSQDAYQQPDDCDIYPDLALFGADQTTLDPQLGMEGIADFGGDIDVLVRDTETENWGLGERESMIGEEQVCYDEWLE